MEIHFFGSTSAPSTQPQPLALYYQPCFFTVTPNPIGEITAQDRTLTHLLFFFIMNGT